MDVEYPPPESEHDVVLKELQETVTFPFIIVAADIALSWTAIENLDGYKIISVNATPSIVADSIRSSLPATRYLLAGKVPDFHPWYAEEISL